MEQYYRRRLCRPHTPSVASAPSSSARPQHPRAPVSVPPARLHRWPQPCHQCPPGTAPKLFQVFCLRCAVHATTDPSAICWFDRPESVKCRYCREQKSLCDPVSDFRCCPSSLSRSILLWSGDPGPTRVVSLNSGSINRSSSLRYGGPIRESEFGPKVWRSSLGTGVVGLRPGGARFGRYDSSSRSLL